MVTAPYVPRLKARYREEIVPALANEFQYKNPMRVPNLAKVSINIGLGEALTDGNAIESAVKDLSILTGQRPVVTRATKSIAQFRLREGNPIGVMCTLR